MHPPSPSPQCAPSEDELKLLRSFLEAGGRPEALADAERFAWELGQVRGGAGAVWSGSDQLCWLPCLVHAGWRPVRPLATGLPTLSEAHGAPHPLTPQVPRLAPRLRCLLFQHEAPGQLEDALGTLRCHAVAQRELRASATFEALLRHALVLG